MPGISGFGSYTSGGGATEKQQVFTKSLVKESFDLTWEKLYGHSPDYTKAENILTSIGVKSSLDWDDDFAISVAKEVRRKALDWAENLDTSQMTKESASQLISSIKSWKGVTGAFGKAFGGGDSAELLDRIMGGKSRFIIIGEGKNIVPMPRESKFWSDPESFDIWAR